MRMNQKRTVGVFIATYTAFVGSVFGIYKLSNMQYIFSDDGFRAERTIDNNNLDTIINQDEWFEEVSISDSLITLPERKYFPSHIGPDSIIVR